MHGNHVEIGMVPDERGRPRFTVEVIDRAGGAIRLWTGPSYEAAILEAEDARADFGPVADRVLDDVCVWASRQM